MTSRIISMQKVEIISEKSIFKGSILCDFFFVIHFPCLKSNFKIWNVAYNQFSEKYFALDFVNVSQLSLGRHFMPRAGVTI